MRFTIYALWIGLCVWTMRAWGDGTPYVPASQAEVNAGVNAWKGVTPATLANSIYAGGPTNGQTAVQVTNIVQHTLLPVTNLLGTIAQSNLPVIDPFNSVRVEDFGAVADLKTIYDVSTTNAGQIIYSASAGFTSADIGKVLVVYTDGNNTNWTVSFITNVLSPTMAQLSNTCSATVNGMTANYGTDDASAYSNAIRTCYAQQIHNLYATNGGYMIYGTLTATGSNQISVINFPAPTYSATNLPYTLEIVGAAPVGFPLSGYFSFACPRNGTVLFCPQKQTQSTNCCVFGYSSTNALYTSLNIVWRNIEFVQPVRPQLTWHNNYYGGTVSVLDSAGLVDFGAGKINQISGGAGATFFVAAGPNSNGDQRIQNCFIAQYDCAIQSGDHVTISSTTTSANGVGLLIPDGNMRPLQGLCLVNNITNIAATASAGFPHLDGWAYIENSGGTTIHDIWDQNGYMSGTIGFSGWIPRYDTAAKNGDLPTRLNIFSPASTSDGSITNFYGATFAAIRGSGIQAASKNSAGNLAYDFPLVWGGKHSAGEPGMAYDSNFRQQILFITNADFMLQGADNSRPVVYHNSSYTLEAFNVSVDTNLMVRTIVCTNLTLSTTSAAPVSTTPVVWFLITNAGVAYKIGGCQ